MEQIIKFGISNYLQLCVEAGFSQIQSHMHSLLSNIRHIQGLSIDKLAPTQIKFTKQYCTQSRLEMYQLIQCQEPVGGGRPDSHLFKCCIHHFLGITVYS